MSPQIKRLLLLALPLSAGSLSAESPSINKKVDKKIGQVHFHQYPVAGTSKSTKEAIDRISGYDSLKNALIVAPIIKRPQGSHEIYENDLLSPEYKKNLYEQDTDFWPKLIQSERGAILACEYIEDNLYLAIKGAKKLTYEQMTSMNVTPLTLDDMHVVSYEGYETPEEKQAVTQVVKLTKATALALAKKYVKDGVIELSKEVVMSAYEEEALKNSSSTVTKAILETSFAAFDKITFTLKTGFNEVTLLLNEKVVHTRSFGPEAQRSSFNGGWLAETDFKALIRYEKAAESSPFEKDGLTAGLHFLDYTAGSSEHVRLIKLMFMVDDLKERYNTLICFIKNDDYWYSCVVQKHDTEFHVTATDSRNEDRSEDPAVKQVCDHLNDELRRLARAGSSATGGKKEKEDFELLSSLLDPKPSTKAKDKAEPEVNYDAPLAHIPLEELPSLEDLIGNEKGELPNYIQLLQRRLKAPVGQQGAGTKLKNCYIFEGPPGCGKSTLIQVLAREGGLEIVYAGGGDFRTAYQGSGKAKLDELFAQAKKVREKTGKRVAIMIDEIDGTSSKIDQRGSTEEDNRALKSLITTLDQHRHDPDLYIFCTTNYPDRIDPAIMRRFTTIAIPLPTFEGRKKIVERYFNLNGVKVNGNIVGARKAVASLIKNADAAQAA